MDVINVLVTLYIPEKCFNINFGTTECRYRSDDDKLKNFAHKLCLQTNRGLFFLNFEAFQNF